MIFEMNIIAHSFPPFVDTGNRAFTHFLNIISKFLKASDDAIETIILVSDNYVLIPVEKNAEHDRRALKEPSTKPVRDITDEYCPNGSDLNGNPEMIYQLICYLLNRFAIHVAAMSINGIATGTNLPSIYITCPSRRVSAVDATVVIRGVAYHPGDNVLLNGAASNHPAKFADGEGEICAWLWASWLHSKNEFSRILINSIDTDNIGIAMLMKSGLKARVVIALQSVTRGATRTLRTFDCAPLSEYVCVYTAM